VTNDKLNLLWIGCGRKDFLSQANQKFVERLKTDNIKHVTHITVLPHPAPKQNKPNKSSFYT